MRAALATLRRPHGYAAVEFSAGLMVFVLALFAMFDSWRALYTWNTLSAATRSVARTAIVSAINGSAIDAAKVKAILAVDGKSTSLGPDVEVGAIEVQYLNLALTQVASLPASGNANVTTCSANPSAANCVRFVQVRMCQPNSNGCAPLTFASEHTVVPADLNDVRWVSHCRDLVRLPVAA